MSNIVRQSIDIHAPLEEVWQLIATEAGLRRWWGADVALEAKEGGRCEESGVFQGQPYHRVGKVTHYDPPREIRLALEEQMGLVWPPYVTVVLTLTPHARHVCVTVEQHAPLEAVDAVSSRQIDPVSHAPSTHWPTLQLDVKGEPIGAVGRSSRRSGKTTARGASEFTSLWTARLAALQQECAHPDA